MTHFRDAIAVFFIISIATAAVPASAREIVLMRVADPIGPAIADMKDKKYGRSYIDLVDNRGANILFNYIFIPFLKGPTLSFRLRLNYGRPALR